MDRMREERNMGAKEQHRESDGAQRDGWGEMKHWMTRDQYGD